MEFSKSVDAELTGEFHGAVEAIGEYFVCSV